MAVVFDHPKSLLDVSTHFCPGCGHGIVHRLVCEVIDEMGIEGDTIGVVPVCPITISAATSLRRPTAERRQWLPVQSV